MKRTFFTFVFSILFLSIGAFSPSAFAKMINLYAEPKADAKIIQEIDLSAGIVPIYTPKEGGWMKVGDPKNGNVGWIKSSEINDAKSISVTQKVMIDEKSDNKTPNTNLFPQTGQPAMTKEEAQMLLQMQKQQQEFQKNLPAITQEITNNVVKMLKTMGAELPAAATKPLPVATPPTPSPPTQPNN